MQEGNVWLEFGACEGAKILAVDFGQQGEVLATCEPLRQKFKISFVCSSGSLPAGNASFGPC